LYYNRARYYSPEMGRFIGRDPIDVGDDVNLYRYCGNNGVRFVDPMGTDKQNIEGNIFYDIKAFL
ncbi:RHS repeat-associated core domain-containing protein, partial [bacterium]|nr:RHS repeat-associated core domain-containing protein [bacterium]